MQVRRRLIWDGIAGRFAPVAGIVLGLMALVVPVASSSSVLNMPLFASSVGTAFTYQGHLQMNGVPAAGPCDMQLGLFDAPTPTVQVGTTQTRLNVPVTNGQFTIPDLDFGNVFNGDARWLQIAVRCPAGGGAYTTLNPLVALTPTPYAIFASSAGTANTANSATTAASFTGNLAGDVTGTQGATTVAKLQGQPISSTAPSANQVLQFSGGQWTPSTLSIPEPEPPAFIHVYRMTPQTLNPFDDVEFDAVAISTGQVVIGPDGVLIFTISGYYKVSYTAFVTSGAIFCLAKNDVQMVGTAFWVASNEQVNGHAIAFFNAGDVLTLKSISPGPAVLSGPPVGPAATTASMIVERLQ